MSAWTFSLEPVDPSNLPSEDALIAAGQDILADSQTWIEGESFPSGPEQDSLKRLRTFTPAQPTGRSGASSKYASGSAANGNNQLHWLCRTSQHPRSEATLDELYHGYMGRRDRSELEKEFIPEVQQASLVQGISATQSIWATYYRLPAPLAPRVYCVLQVFRLIDSEVGKRNAIIVTIPVSITRSSIQDHFASKLNNNNSGSPPSPPLNVSSSTVIGVYITVEQVRELSPPPLAHEDEVLVEWRMITCGRAGGWIPDWFSNKMMPKKTAEDVPHLLEWIQRKGKSRRRRMIMMTMRRPQGPKAATSCSRFGL